MTEQHLTDEENESIMAGRCPKCGSQDLDWGSLVPDGHEAFQRTNCISCKFEWFEIYTYSHSLHYPPKP